jgi:hypothetical protein
MEDISTFGFIFGIYDLDTNVKKNLILDLLPSKGESGGSKAGDSLEQGSGGKPKQISGSFHMALLRGFIFRPELCLEGFMILRASHLHSRLFDFHMSSFSDTLQHSPHIYQGR